jgi:hypothetical protein
VVVVVVVALLRLDEISAQILRVHDPDSRDSYVDSSALRSPCRRYLGHVFDDRECRSIGEEV